MKIASFGVVFFILFVVTQVGISSSFSYTAGVGSIYSVYPIDSKPYGMAYGEWIAKWWQ